jgi:putative transposase
MSIPPKVAVSRVIAEMKGATSHLLNHDKRLDDTFSWSPGYGLFTLGPSQVERAIAYVTGQEHHHDQQTTIPALERTEEDLASAGPAEG